METAAILVVFSAAALFLLYIKGIPAQQLSPAYRRLKSASKYVMAIFVGTYGAAASAALLIGVPLLVYSRWGHSKAAGDLFSALLDRSYFPLQLAFALLLGVLTVRVFTNGGALFAWVLPAMQAIAVVAALSPSRGVFQRFWPWFDKTFLNWRCGCSATLLQWEVMLPLYASVAFSIGIMIGQKLERNREHHCHAAHVG